jgi:hypothetical protein
MTLIFSTEFRKIPKFHENPTIGSQAVPCGQTDRHDEAVAFRNFATRLKMET